jgi:ribosome-binding ATPase YchF (GTP1/OBG family)
VEKNTEAITICAQIEQEINNLDNAQDRQEFFQDLGIKESGLNKLIKSCYNLLGLQTFFTAGPKEARAWTYKKGANAQSAAGLIHTDFTTGFICAETISYVDFIKYGSEQESKNNGCQRKEGRDYIVNDGDVMLFRFNV